MGDQTSFRLTPALARALARRARERGVPKSQLVREALELYLAGGEPLPADRVRERTVSYVGALELDQRRVRRDATASLIREHNWRP
jgi:predicted DNA-binding protein